MNRWRVGEDRGSKEMDGCPLTKGSAANYLLYHMTVTITVTVTTNTTSKREGNRNVREDRE
jgi:hypothetical protein